MKKQIIALAATAAFAAPVFAQSSVTLYGVIDEGVNYTNSVAGHSVVELQSGYAQGSRWGMKGAEDVTRAVDEIDVAALDNGDRLAVRYRAGSRPLRCLRL